MIASINVISINYYCRTDIDEVSVIFFFVSRGTDRHNLGHKNFGSQNFLTQSSKLVVSCRLQYASPDNRNA